MNQFGYAQVQDAAAAAKAASDATARFIAGGTTLVDLMKLGVEKPKQLLDINELGGLDKIEELPSSESGSGLRIGALVRNSDLAHSDEVKRRFPALCEALLSGASPQLRNMATTGGNILQRTRCYYFRDTNYAQCNKRKPGSGCAALEGYNRIHAVLGGSANCIATHPSDMCVALAALDAIVRISGPNGERTVPLTEFHTLPGEHPEIESVLKPGELITAIDMKDSAVAKNSHYLKVRDRASYEFALASAAVGVQVNADGTIQDARVALGGIATKPWRSAEAEKALIGSKADSETFGKAAEAALAGASPQKHNRFKIELAKRTLVRALEEVSKSGAPSQNS